MKLAIWLLAAMFVFSVIDIYCYWYAIWRLEMDRPSWWGWPGSGIALCVLRLAKGSK